MLAQLKIRNFALIDALDVSFDRGLNILSGETGAGKSIIIGAIGLLLGDRASTEMIRSGAEAAAVEAFFDLDEGDPVREKLAEAGLDDGEGMIVRRVMSRSGRNRVYINGSMATLNLLADLGESLMNICGQREHSVMLNADRHLDMLDAFGDLNPLRSGYGALFETRQDLLGRVEKLTEAKNRRTEQEELARFRDANVNLTSAMARTREEKLQSEYTLLLGVYTELAKQKEQAKIAVTETTPILTVIEPVVVPVEKSGPSRAQMLIIYTFLGLIVGVGWVLGVPYVKEVLSKVRKQDK